MTRKFTVISIKKSKPMHAMPSFFGVKMSDDVTMTVQDRAYTSPI